ncbi:MAG TPA: hypothetical protein VN150_06725 [Ochrobactrum sp.]|nr:hypothetical protein [Ochrobactrum sp.]
MSEISTMQQHYRPLAGEQNIYGAAQHLQNVQHFSDLCYRWRRIVDCALKFALQELTTSAIG